MLSQYQLVYIFQTVKSWETVYNWRFQISRGLFGLQVIFKAGLPAYKCECLYISAQTGTKLLVIIIHSLH